MNQSIRLCAFVLAASMLGACGGGSDVGSQDKPALPVAWAKALNQPFTGTGGNIRLDVRAGAEVLLSGADSNGTAVPVIKYKWSVSQAPAGVTVALLKRTESSVSFRAPATTQSLPLQLKLLVTDSSGATDEAVADITVVPVTDPDAFLTYGGTAQTYTVAAVTSVVTSLPNDIAFDIAVERRVTYTDISGVRHADFPLGREVLGGSWLAATGTGGTGSSCGGPQNPRFTLAVPALNADDILARLSDDQLGNALDPALIDSAIVTVKLTLTPKAALPAGLPGLCVLGPANDLVTASAKPTRGSTALATSGEGTAEKIVTLDELLGDASTLYDTRTSAAAYYRTIDPQADAYAAKQTFSGWLRHNGFTNGTLDWDAIKAGSSAHAVYLNNFDLGFGRDMYMRIGQCDGGVTPALGGSIDTNLLGQCDVYGVVVNYGSLEGATKKLAPVLAVAMEYSRVKAGAARVTKFYTYAPDRKGDYTRVLSANLDGRGEKFMPGVCTVCHGGTPQGLAKTDDNGDERLDYGNGGDANAGFLSWDLDAFLYSDTDPSFSRATDPFFPSSEQQLAADYTRARQAGELHKLNQLAYLTFADPAGRAGRFALARELVAGWYGGAGLPNAAFNGSFVPDSWRNGVNGNPADAETVYQEVFAQNCRACHVVQVPGGGANQLAIGSYADLFDNPVNLAKLRDALSDGRMPFARLTMDRFWVSGEGANSPNNILARHLLQQDGQAFTTPGALQVCIDPDVAGDKTLQVMNRTDWVPLTASCSRSVSQYAWTLTGRPDGSQSALVGGNTATPSFLPDKEGDYRITLTAGDESDTLTATLADAKPVLDGTTIVLPIALVGGAGTGTADLDGQYSSRDAITGVSIKATSNVTTAVATVTPVPGAPSQVSISVAANTLKPGFVQYALVDVDGDESVVGQIDTLPSATAPAAQLLAFALDANSAGTINLWPNAAPLLAQIYGVTSAPTLRGADGRFGSTNPAAGAAPGSSALVAYVAPRGIATHFGSLNLHDSSGAALRERFDYQVCYQDSPGNCSANRVDVKVNATQSLVTLATQLRASCAGCHSDTRVGSNLVVKVSAAEQSDAKLRCTLVAGSSAAGASAYPESLGTEPAGTPYLNLAAGAAGSLLYQKASGLQNHHGDGLTNAAWPLAAIQAWISEGALDTADADPTCAAGGSTGSEPVPPTAASATVEVSWSAPGKSRTFDVTTDLGWQNPKGIVIKSSASPGVQAQAVGASEIKVTLDTDLRGGTVTYAVLRADGTEAGTGTLLVDADAAMTLLNNNFTRTLAYAAPLSSTFNVATAAGAPVLPADLARECTMSFSGTLTGNPNGEKATLSQAAPKGCTVTYTAPAGTITHFGGSPPFNTPDSFTYSICWAGSGGDDCDTGSGTMRINGSLSFAASVNTTLVEVCTDCHSGDFPSGAMSFGSAPQVGFSASANHATLLGSAGRVVRGNPGVSLAYLYPSGGEPLVHATQGSAAQHQAIFQWIKEGAYCTGCTP